VQHEAIFVSVHVRRTDYKRWMTALANGFLASKAFYESAMDRDQCYDFENISAKRSVLFYSKCCLSIKWISTLALKKNAYFPPKIVENRRKYWS
jgi:hypothetical protein